MTMHRCDKLIRPTTLNDPSELKTGTPVMPSEKTFTLSLIFLRSLLFCCFGVRSLHIINFNNLCFRVENETTLISAKKNRVDLSSISEVRSYITEWPRFLGHPVCGKLEKFTSKNYT